MTMKLPRITWPRLTIVSFFISLGLAMIVGGLWTLAKHWHG